MLEYDEMSGQAIEIARETLRQLAARRIVPTPDNYRSLYLEIAKGDGSGQPQHAHTRLARLIEKLRGDDAPQAADALAFAVEEKSWDASAQALAALAEHVLKSAPAGDAPAVPPVEAGPLRELLACLLESAVTQLGPSREIADEARVLAGRVRTYGGDGQAELIETLRQFITRMEIQAETAGELRGGLLRLLRLLVENIADLVVDESWVEGQLDAVHDLLSTPDNMQALAEAEMAIREMLARQGSLRSSLRDAKSTLKSMVSTLIERLGSLSDDTGEYQSKIERYTQRMEEVRDVEQLGVLLDDLLADTRHMRTVTAESRAELIAARARAEAAERRVRELETELASVSAKVSEDRLTGTLNRHGFDEAYARETSRAARHETPLAVALLDIDNFKQLNDTLGHGVGDSALQHLVKVIRDTLRPSDVVCRLGGEEFLLLLPETPVAEATQIMIRVQRELTRRIFLHKNDHVLITFSAGVTGWQQPEVQETVIERADRALYDAKKQGKNRVCTAQQ